MEKTNLFSAVFVTTAAFLTTAALTTAVAQPALAQQDQQIQIDQQDIQNYAEARQAVDGIAQELQGQVEDMDASEQKQLNNKLVSTVKDAGMSIEEYNAISGALRENKELQQRVIQAMQK